MTINKSTSNHISWQELFNQLPTGIVLIDGQGVVEACNQAAQGFLGDSIISKPWIDVIKASFAPKADDGHEISLIDGRRVNISISSLQDRAGEMIVINDLTLTRAFEQERERLLRLQEMGEMLAHLAHQIRTPLASAMLYVKNLQHPNLSADKHAGVINKIRYCHQNIEQQIRDLLVFAKGGESLLQTVDMYQFLRKIEQKTEAKLNEMAGELIVENQANGLSFICQSDALEGALSNLIDNALNFNAKKIYLNIVNQQNQKIIFNVIDDGDGIAEEELSNITRPFFTTRAKGTGLGLAVVDAVVKAHHGELKILSKKGIGSTFSIQIPLLSEKMNKEVQ